MELRRSALAVLGGVVLLATSCSSSPPTASGTSQTPPTTSVFAAGGTATVAVPYLPRNFNPSTPAGANSVTQMVMAQVWPQAFVVDPEFDEETQGFIDSAEVVSLRPMTVTYAIDPKATWSDGYPITVADFEYNWKQRLLAGAELAPIGELAGYRDIESISGSDGGKTVTVVFKTPYTDWEGLFANLVPAHIAERAGWAAAFNGFHPSEVISGGPFIVSSMTPDKRLVLTRNAKYWGIPAHLETIVFLVERSERATLAGLKNGSVSIAQLQPSASLNATVAQGGVVAPQLSIDTDPSPTLWQLTFNINDPLLDNSLMREALAEITNRDQLVADSVGFDDPGTTSADSRLFAEGEPGPGTDMGSLRYDPIRAASIFATLGYLPDANGVLRDNAIGAPLTLSISGPTGDSVIYDIELQLQAQWAACGVTLVIRNVSMTDLLSRVLPQGGFQLALAPYVMPAFPTWDALDYTDPVMPSPLSPTTLSLHVGSIVPALTPPVTGTALLWDVETQPGTEPGAVTAGGVTRDVTGLNVPAVSRRFGGVMVELNTQTQIVRLTKLDELLTRNMATLPLFQEPISLVQQADIVNVSESPSSVGPMWDAEDWVIEVTTPAG